MFGTLKKLVKIGLVGSVVLGTAAVATVAVAGESRTRAVVHEVHSSVLKSIDEAIEDPAALRSQLREMEREYPEKIAQVRGDLSELRFEIRELEREQAISERVVALVDEDLDALELELASDPGPEPDPTYRTARYASSPTRAAARVEKLSGQRVHYVNRRNDAEHSLGYLRHQESRLEALLAKLEAEQDEFQTQIAGLSRQIDAISRNDRLIELLEKRNRTIEECSRYEAASLDQITNRLASITSRQEAELDLLVTAESGTNYEQEARMQIANEGLRSPNAPGSEPERRELSTAQGR